MLQHHKEKVPYSIETINSLCAGCYKLDSFEDFELKKRFWTNKNGPFLLVI